MLIHAYLVVPIAPVEADDDERLVLEREVERQLGDACDVQALTLVEVAEFQLRTAADTLTLAADLFDRS